MSLGLTVSSLFQQLGILEEFQSLGKPFCNMDIFNENLAQSARLDLSYREALYVIYIFYLSPTGSTFDIPCP